MTVDVDNPRHFSLQILGLIEDGCAVEAGNNLVAQFAHAVTLSRQGTCFFESGWSVHPFLWPAVKHNILQQVLAEALRFGCPLFGTGRRRGLGRFFQEILLHLKHGDCRGLNLLRQHGCQLPGTALPDGDPGIEEPWTEREGKEIGRLRNGRASQKPPQ